MTAIEDIQKMGTAMKELLGLSGSPVGVRIVKRNDEIAEAEPAGGHRFCQALMRGRRGDHVVVTAETIACPAAARAFGFKPLPEALKSGKGLVGFGITAEESVGQQMFAGMTTCKPGEIVQLDVFPLDAAGSEPDIVVVEDEVEKLMWIVLAYMHARGGERVSGSTAVLQATCVDATIIPYLEDRLNYGFGCYGCRDATDMAGGEAILGFPAHYLPGIVRHLEYLNRKALPHSRGKHALAALTKQRGGGDPGSCSSL
ncbi:hypothetical protein ABH15_05635 [Methanoculleus taiwanensis]|uniref:DUF169 domain-containing protein n=1 Tax=Methanoculleus taiwanensis TaxID=1550565 RepID=A0A498GYD8_9EURY|nr:DUF169 domain-containing protein [Methanoculleus taiwanensis]RXE55719.1 hypothetical protein ABH15_05635 [Methanoculleus taiwanensis]